MLCGWPGGEYACLLLLAATYSPCQPAWLPACPHPPCCPPPPHPPLQEGAVDEVSFCAPELGPLAALLVGPEAGRWVCEEVDVSSSRTGHTDRWVGRAGRVGGVLLLGLLHSGLLQYFELELTTCLPALACPCLPLPCRFVWREALGEGCNEAAAYLKPVPPGAVVYGTGDSAIIISKASTAGAAACTALLFCCICCTLAGCS
jgi:hypothetical protein